MAFIKEISRSRTFGFLNDIENMREKGRALGGSLENAIVLDPYRLLNPHGLRDRDEFVKHKILDAIGDLYLIGHPLIGHYSGYKSGHSLKPQAVTKTPARRKAWEHVVFKEKTGAREIQFFRSTASLFTRQIHLLAPPLKLLQKGSAKQAFLPSGPPKPTAPPI